MTFKRFLCGAASMPPWGRLVALIPALSMVAWANTAQDDDAPVLPPAFIPKQRDQAARDEDFPKAQLAEVSRFIRVGLGRHEFGVDGGGLTVAILDSGLRASHVDFSPRAEDGTDKRVPIQVNLTSDNGGDTENASDGSGHGTHVAGIIAANGRHTGMAPRARIIPIKVITDQGKIESWGVIDRALQWVLDHREAHNISVVNISIGDKNNFVSEQATTREREAIRGKIRELRALRIAVVISSGNGYAQHAGRQGMAFPGIVRECVSVGALFDVDGVQKEWPGLEAAVTRSIAGQIAPFSQRLDKSSGDACSTDIFSPGAQVLSSGIRHDDDEAEMDGTSMACPVVSGVVLLLQQYHMKNKGVLPSVDELEVYLKQRGVKLIDGGQGQEDNVPDTNSEFLGLDAFDALQVARERLTGQRFDELRAHGSGRSSVQFPILTEEVKDKAGATTAYTQAKISRRGDGGLVELTVRIKKTGISGTGHAYGQVVLLDTNGNTLAKTGIVHEQQGANFVTGLARDETTEEFPVSIELVDKIARAVVIVKARDNNGLPESVEMFAKEAERIQEAIRKIR